MGAHRDQAVPALQLAPAFRGPGARRPRSAPWNRPVRIPFSRVNLNGADMTPHDPPGGADERDPGRSATKPEPAPTDPVPASKTRPPAADPAAPGGVEQPKNDRRKRGDLQKRDL